MGLTPCYTWCWSVSAQGLVGFAHTAAPTKAFSHIQCRSDADAVCVHWQCFGNSVVPVACLGVLGRARCWLLSSIGCIPVSAYLSGWGGAELGEVLTCAASWTSPPAVVDPCWVWSPALVLSWVGSSCKSLHCTTACEQQMAQTTFSAGISLLMSISRDCCVDRTLE